MRKNVKIALAGNPNVGKSTVFNALTGLKQHTGNWTGKTVSIASGEYKYNNVTYEIVDIPGTYSLTPHSKEEAVARDFLCFADYDKVLVVCDATSLERNLYFVYQLLELQKDVVVCVNLLDEARKKGIEINLKLLSYELGVAVVGTEARNEKGIEELKKALESEACRKRISISYESTIETALEYIYSAIFKMPTKHLNKRWLALRLLLNEENFCEKLKEYLGFDLIKKEVVLNALEKADIYLNENGIDKEQLTELLA